MQLKILDLIDIVLVAIILYQLYKLIRGTAAFSIFIGIFLVYLFWLIVKALNMELIGTILGQVIGVGVIALIIVFQQEIRRFLLFVGNRYIRNQRFTFSSLFPEGGVDLRSRAQAEEIVRAVSSMSESKTGALIVIGRKSNLDLYTASGVMIDSEINAPIIESLFYDGAPLHDGALIIQNRRIMAARCPLPVSESPLIPKRFGMRHRAAVGITEQTDSVVVVVSEESGKISVADSGEMHEDLNSNELRTILQKEKF